MAEASENKSEGSAGAASGAVSGGAAGGGSKMLPLLTVLNLLVTVAMLALMFIHFNKEQKKPAIEDLAAGDSKGHEGAASGAKEGEHGAAAGGEHGGAGEKKVTEFGRMVNLEQFTVNLATPGSVNPKFVRVNVSIEVPTTDAEGEVNSKMPQVRNTIIDLFNSKKPGDLATVEGRDYLKEEIKNALNGFMITGKVKGVFFTNFALSS